jgi:ABC-type polysaccharide/polyol phosphate export permease
MKVDKNLCKYTWKGGYWWSISTPSCTITSDLIIASSLINLCWKMKVLHFLIKVINGLCDWFVGSSQREDTMHMCKN